MRELSKLYPAQTLLLTEGKKASLKDLLKFTFMDLLLKQVLKTEKRTYRASKYDKEQIVKYVLAGNNFSAYKPAAHELAFLEPFKKSRTISIMFRHIVKMGYQNARKENLYQLVIGNTYPTQEYFSRNFFHYIFGGFSLTSRGRELKVKVEKELEELDDTLPLMMVRNKEKAMEILKEIKGNVFLLKNVSLSLLGEIDKELMEEMNPRNTGNGGDSGCAACGTWGSDWHSFDASC
ncbi:MAG: hypothetical protein ACJ75J_04665, partial [Cytophagaceae bacterium]